MPASHSDGFTRVSLYPSSQTSVLMVSWIKLSTALGSYLTKLLWMQLSLSTAESLAGWEEKMEFHLCVEGTYQDLHRVSSKAPFHILSLGSLVLIPTQLLKLSFKAPFRIRLECASCEQDRVRECCLQKALHGKHFRPWQSYIGFWETL